MEEMYCIVINVKDPLNYDVVFPENPDFPDSEFTKENSKECKLAPIDPVTYEREKEIICLSYRIKIEGITIENKTYDRVILNEIKYKIIQWITNNDATFICRFKSYDHNYGRIIADLYCPKTDRSISEWLLGKYPGVYSRFQRRNSRSPSSIPYASDESYQFERYRYSPGPSSPRDKDKDGHLKCPNVESEHNGKI